MKYARAIGTNEKAVANYLPRNYRVVGHSSDGNDVFIAGEDDHGWTRDGYVIPRLASGLIVCRAVPRIEVPVHVTDRAEKPDFSVLDEGTVVIFTPETEQAQAWVAENVGLEDYQRIGECSFVVDHRPAQWLLDTLHKHGFHVRERA